MKVGIKREWHIPDSVVETIIEMAGYGIYYWAENGYHDTEAKEYIVTESSEYGGYMRTLSYEALAQALVDVAYDPKVNVRDDFVGYARETLDELEAGEEFPGGSIDSDLADIIVQYAMFGEVVYG